MADSWQPTLLADETADVETARMMCTCPGCRAPHVEDVPARDLSRFFYLVSVRGGGQPAYRACRKCGKGLHRWERLAARRNAAVRCDARCLNARRASCECSCAGANHGRYHL